MFASLADRGAGVGEARPEEKELDSRVDSFPDGERWDLPQSSNEVIR